MNIEMANRLYNYRKQSGLSQEELAEKLGLSRQSVSKWERAEACPDTDNLIRLSKLYGVSIDTLLHIDPDEIITDNETETSFPGDQTAKINKEKTAPGENGSGEGGGAGENGNSGDGVKGEFYAKKDPDRDGIRFGGGIHIVDGKDKVNIDRTGIHVEDGDDVVHIGWKGIKIKQKGESDLRISFGGAKGDENGKNPGTGKDSASQDRSGKDENGKEDGTESVPDKDVRVHFNIRDRRKKYIKEIPVGLFITITYIFIGILWNLWHPGWILFICIPIIDSIISALTYGSIRKFNYPVFVLAAYLFAGSVYGYWHPAWVSFLTIPLFYWIF